MVTSLHNSYCVEIKRISFFHSKVNDVESGVYGGKQMTGLNKNINNQDTFAPPLEDTREFEKSL